MDTEISIYSLINRENLVTWIAQQQKRRKPATFVLLAIVLLLGVGLRLSNMNNVVDRSPDERVYAMQANILSRDGMQGIHTIIDKFRGEPKLFYYPTPNRVGYLWLLSRTMVITGKNGPEVGAWISCVASICVLLLIALIGWEFWGAKITLLALFFFALSPVELAWARRGWQESLIEFLALVLMYITCKLTTNERPAAWLLPLFIVVGGAFITIKELTGLILAFCIFWVLWVLLQRRDRKRAIIFLGGITVAIGVALLWEAHFFGGLRGLASFILRTWQTDASNPYRLLYQGGPRYRLFAALWVLCPLACIFCALGLVAVFQGPTQLLPKSSRCVAIWLAIYFAFFLSIPVLVPYRMNLRYLNMLMGPFYLLAALGFLQLLSFARSHLDKTEYRVCASILCFVLLLGGFADYRNFRTRFVLENTSELAAKAVLDSGNEALPAFINVNGVQNQAELLSKSSAALQLAMNEPTMEHWLQLAYLLHMAGQSQSCILALQNALRAKPDSPEVYNDLSVAYGSMHDWDNSINAAQKALGLKPDYEQAKKNLDIALQEKRNSIH